MKNFRIVMVNFLAAAALHQFPENHLNILSPKNLFTSFLPYIKRSHKYIGRFITQKYERSEKNIDHLKGNRYNAYHVICQHTENSLCEYFSDKQYQHRGYDRLNNQDHGFAWVDPENVEIDHLNGFSQIDSHKCGVQYVNNIVAYQCCGEKPFWIFTEKCQGAPFK